jgi:hypothetical protein
MTLTRPMIANILPFFNLKVQGSGESEPGSRVGTRRSTMTLRLTVTVTGPLPLEA